jgi:hypothetical protein
LIQEPALLADPWVVAGFLAIPLCGRIVAALTAVVITPSAGVLAARVAGPRRRRGGSGGPGLESPAEDPADRRGRLE